MGVFLKSNRMNKFTLIAGIALLSLGSCKSNTPDSSEDIVVNVDASAPELPDFEVKDASGKVVNLKSLKGKNVLVNIWASWCPPCKAEMPSLASLYSSVDASKASFVMLAIDDDFMNSLQWLSEKNIKVPAYYPMGNLPELFNVQGIPATFIFNKDGKLIKKIDGAENYNTGGYKRLLSK